MTGKTVSRLGAFLLTFALLLPLAPKASAGWEPGILVVPKPACETGQPSASPEAKTELARLLNLERAAAGLSSFTETPAIDTIADIRAHEACAVFSHTRPDGSSCSSVFSEYGLEFSAFGENLAFGYPSPAQAIAAWMNSDGHRANILGSFTHIGIGAYTDADGTVYYAILFWTPQANTN